VSWDNRFAEPILLPDGTQLNTLREAVSYLARTVPKSERDMPAITTAAERPKNGMSSGSPWTMIDR
jgi:hypothetical protein